MSILAPLLVGPSPFTYTSVATDVPGQVDAVFVFGASITSLVVNQNCGATPSTCLRSTVFTNQTNGVDTYAVYLAPRDSVTITYVSLDVPEVWEGVLPTPVIFRFVPPSVTSATY